jgi:hypothetical protein
VRSSGLGFIVTTRKIAARVSGADTGCGTDITPISRGLPNWRSRLDGFARAGFLRYAFVFILHVKHKAFNDFRVGEA